ncbi:MAG: RICIN domain-containing protein, partial [Fibrobacteres bacterium]|nr:RICIN domain-containing protein [Fibrobacterota bacterium]
MPTFEFADCPTSLDLAATPDTREQVGSVRCTLRNTSSRKQGARIRVEPLGGAEAKWFALADAPATAPLEIEQDIDAGGTLTVTAAVKVPGGASAGNQTFRLRVISETAPDTDFAEGPAISFNIAALAEPEVKRTPFPWWAVVVGLVMLLAVGGAVGYLLWPKDHGFDGRHVLLANAKTLKCLMIQDGNAGNNILAVQTTCKDEPLQTWVLKQMEPPKLQIRNAQTNKCLTIAGG